MDKLVKGDKVLVLPRIDDESSYWGNYTDEMLQYKNRIAAVTICGPNHCLLDIDGGYYVWDPKALLKLDKPVNYYDLSAGNIVVFKIGEDYIKGVVKVSSISSFYIRVEYDDISKLNKLCGITVAELTKKFAGISRNVLLAKSKEKLKEMLDFINALNSTKPISSIQPISESESNSLNKEPLNQKSYVVKLQRTKASVRRAEVPEGNRVCSKVHKTAISSQSLSYSICTR